MNKNILIVDDIHPIFIEQAGAMGYRCDYQPAIKPDEAYQILTRYEGLVIRSKFLVDRKVLDLSKNLQFICRAGAGMDNIDEGYAKKKTSCLLMHPKGIWMLSASML